MNSQKGTITNDYGFYSLTLAKDSVKLRISFSGFETQIISEFYENDISLNFKLKDVLLNEVEIIGKPVKDMYGAPMGKILGTSTDIDGTIQTVGINCGSEGLKQRWDNYW